MRSPRVTLPHDIPSMIVTAGSIVPLPLRSFWIVKLVAVALMIGSRQLPPGAGMHTGTVVGLKPASRTSSVMRCSTARTAA